MVTINIHKGRVTLLLAVKRRNVTSTDGRIRKYSWWAPGHICKWRSGECLLSASVTRNLHVSCTCVSYWTNTCEGGHTLLDLMGGCMCVCAQYLRGESGNENNLRLIRTRSLCCPGRAWHLQPSLGSTFTLYSRTSPQNYALPYNWFASVPKSTHKATPDFTRFLFKEKKMTQATGNSCYISLAVYDKNIQRRKQEKFCLKPWYVFWDSLVLPFFLLFTWFLP